MHQHMAVVVILYTLGTTFVFADSMDSFRYIKGEALWSHTKANFESENSKDFAGFTADAAIPFNQYLFFRGDMEYQFRGDNNNQTYYNLGVGGIVRADAPLDIYGQFGVFGFSRNREISANIDAQGSSQLRHLDDMSYSLEVGLIADLYPGKLNVAYRFINVTEHAKEFLVNTTYPWKNNYFITLGYKNRNWEIQDGHIFSLGLRYHY